MTPSGERVAIAIVPFLRRSGSEPKIQRGQGIPRSVDGAILALRKYLRELRRGLRVSNQRRNCAIMKSEDIHVPNTVTDVTQLFNSNGRLEQLDSNQRVFFALFAFAIRKIPVEKSH